MEKSLGNLTFLDESKSRTFKNKLEVIGLLKQPTLVKLKFNYHEAKTRLILFCTYVLTWYDDFYGSVQSSFEGHLKAIRILSRDNCTWEVF